MPITPPGATRLASIDFWRGLCLCEIFINHVPGNFYERYTHRNFGFSDATEIFVLLAGISAAIVYLPAIVQRGFAVTAFRILQRAFQLYMAHIVLVIACGAIVAWGVMSTGDTRLLATLHFDILINDTPPALVGLATLGLQPGYLNILPLYIVLLLMAPGLLLLVRASPMAAVGASGILYLTAQFWLKQIPSYPDQGHWFLNPLAWQFLFVVGAVLGRTILSGQPMRPRPILLGISIAYLLVSMVWIQSGFYPDWNLSPLPLFMWEFDKSNMFLPRLLHVMALIVVALHLPLEATLRERTWARPLVVLGRHSLPVFCLGTVLAIASQMTRLATGGEIVIDSVLIAGGLAAQFGLAGVLEWYRSGQRAAVRDVPQRSF